jgi:hypothetical protein
MRPLPVAFPSSSQLRSRIVSAKKPKDHYVAASLLGRFSSRPRARQRENPLYVLRRKHAEAFQQTAEGVASQAGLYTLDDAWLENSSPRLVDETWQRLEARLSRALDELERTNGMMDARLWAEVMVPFIAATFVRTPDFADRFGLRFAAPGAAGSELEQPDSINRARLLQLQRLFSPVMRARWRLLRSTATAPLITSNLSMAPMTLMNRPGWVFPLGRTLALHLSPRPRTPRVWLTAPWDQTLVDIEIETIGRNAAHRINRLVASHAPDEIYGDPEELVLAYRAELKKAKPKATSMHWDKLVILRRNQHELLDFLIAIASPFDGPRVSREDAIAQMSYPGPIFFSANPASHMPQAESRALSLIEDAEAQKEYTRISRWLDVSPLQKVRAEETDTSESEPGSADPLELISPAAVFRATDYE